MNTDIPAIRVAACIIPKGDRFLITKRLKQSHLGHLWEFPGGKIELGESIEDCAIRECREEIAVEVKPIRLVQEIKHTYPEVKVHLYFMLCELISGEPQTIECADLTWATPEEFENYEFPEADKKIIAEYILNQSSMEKN